jgi:hypothetical protein
VSFLLNEIVILDVCEDLCAVWCRTRRSKFKSMSLSAPCKTF